MPGSVLTIDEFTELWLYEDGFWRLVQRQPSNVELASGTDLIAALSRTGDA